MKCNGTQHWATILRDKEGASKVGIVELTDEQDPEDVYNSVGDNLFKLLKNDIDDNKYIDEINKLLGYPLKRLYSLDVSKAMATEWYRSITKKENNARSIDRTFVKRPTMTSTYSAGQKAFKNFVKNYIIDNGVSLTTLDQKGKPLELSKDEVSKYIAYISKYLQCAIDMTVKLRNGMNYVQECVKARLELLGKPIAPLHYTSAIGFHVYLDDVSTYKVITRSYNKKTQRYSKLTLKHRNDIGEIKYDYLKFSTAIAPDFIHSNDASHMFMTVNAATEIKNWALVHDDYATSLCDWDMLDYHIREEFIKLYDKSKSLLVKFQKELLDVSDIEDSHVRTDYENLNENCLDLPLPPRGELDINVIRKSPYFFI